MKKLLLFLIVACSTAYAPRPVNQSLTPEERKFAIDYFEKTKARLFNDLKGLSPAQLAFKADSTRWSVAQCVEHIALAETLLWQWGMSTMQQAPAPEKRSEIKISNDKLIAMVLDRSVKIKAPEMLQPKNKFSSTEGAIKAYTLRRDSTIAYLGSTQDDLKDHFIKNPVFGTLDIYQAMLLIAAHSERHTLQVEEVMNNPDFPKK